MDPVNSDNIADSSHKTEKSETNIEVTVGLSSGDNWSYQTINSFLHLGPNSHEADCLLL